MEKRVESSVGKKTSVGEREPAALRSEKTVVGKSCNEVALTTKIMARSRFCPSRCKRPVALMPSGVAAASPKRLHERFDERNERVSSSRVSKRSFKRGRHSFEIFLSSPVSVTREKNAIQTAYEARRKRQSDPAFSAPARRAERYDSGALTSIRTEARTKSTKKMTFTLKNMILSRRICPNFIYFLPFLRYNKKKRRETKRWQRKNPII